MKTIINIFRKKTNNDSKINPVLVNSAKHYIKDLKTIKSLYGENLNNLKTLENIKGTKVYCYTKPNIIIIEHALTAINIKLEKIEKLLLNSIKINNEGEVKRFLEDLQFFTNYCKNEIQDSNSMFTFYMSLK